MCCTPAALVNKRPPAGRLLQPTPVPQAQRYRRFHAALLAVNERLSGVYARLTGGHGDAYCRRAALADTLGVRLAPAQCLPAPPLQSSLQGYHIGSSTHAPPLHLRSYTEDPLAAFTDGVTFHVRCGVGGPAG